MIRLAHIRARLTHAYTTARDEIGVWLDRPAAMGRVMHWPLDEEDGDA